MLKRTDLNELVNQMQIESGLTKTKFAEVAGLVNKQQLNSIINRNSKGTYFYKVGFNLFEKICEKLGYNFTIEIERKENVITFDQNGEQNN